MTLSNAFCQAYARFEVMAYDNRRISDYVYRLRDRSVTFRRLPSAISLRTSGLFSLQLIRQLRRSNLIGAIRRFQASNLLRRIRRLFLNLFCGLIVILIIGLLRLALGMNATRIEDRSGSNILRIRHASLIINRASIIRCLRRGIRRVQVDLFSFVRRRSEVQFPTCNFDGLAAFVMACMSQEHAGRA